MLRHFAQDVNIRIYPLFGLSAGKVDNGICGKGFDGDRGFRLWPQYPGNAGHSLSDESVRPEDEFLYGQAGGAAAAWWMCNLVVLALRFPVPVKSSLEIPPFIIL